MDESGGGNFVSFTPDHVAGLVEVVVLPGLVVSFHLQFLLEGAASPLANGAGELEQGAEHRALRREQLERGPERLKADAERPR